MCLTQFDHKLLLGEIKLVSLKAEVHLQLCHFTKKKCGQY